LTPVYVVDVRGGRHQEQESRATRLLRVVDALGGDARGSALLLIIGAALPVAGLVEGGWAWRIASVLIVVLDLVVILGLRRLRALDEARRASIRPPWSADDAQS